MKIDAKKEFLNEMKKKMIDKFGENYGDKLKTLKKVTVVAPNDEDLETGLSKAQQILRNKMKDNGDFENEDKSPIEKLFKDKKEEEPEQAEESHCEEILEKCKNLPKEEISKLIDSLSELLKEEE